MNAAAGCVPAVRTGGGFTSTDIPVALVATTGSVISSITDDRTIFQTPGTGGGGGGGGTAVNGVIVTANYNPSCGQFVRSDATGPITITLPAAITVGCSFAIERGSAAGVVTINPNGVSYDGVTTQLPQGEAIYIYTDGTVYHSQAPMVAGDGCTMTPSLTGNSWTCSSGSSVLTTKGDVVGFSTAAARIPVGAGGPDR